MSFRDAPLDFQGGRKFCKKNHPRHEDEKKIAKNHPRHEDEKKIAPVRVQMKNSPLSPGEHFLGNFQKKIHPREGDEKNQHR